MTRIAAYQACNPYFDDIAYVPSERMKHCRILLIEDSKADVILFRKMMKGLPGCEEFEISDAPRMSDVFDTLSERSYDIILLDLCLVDIDGSASVAALHAISPNIPIIVYSGNDDIKLKEEALFCGAKHYLVKGKESPFAIKYMIQETRIHAQL